MDLTPVLLLLVGLALGAATAVALRRQPAPAYDASITDALARLDGQLRAIETTRERAYGGLLATVTDVRAETEQLVNALRAPHVRGQWGEMQLRRVLEAAGALEHCDFVAQPTSSTSDGTLRPDVVIHLAGGKHVVVDAKCPLGAYLEAAEAPDEALRDERLRAHARRLREHVAQLSAKEYWARFDPAPEFVVLFVPSDAVLDAALRADATLQEAAFASDVVLATPSTLVALVRTVAYTWRQEALTEGAREVSRVGRELYDRLARLGGHLDRLGRSLTASVESYNSTVGSLEARVLVSARKLATLGVSDEELASPRTVDSAARALAAPELDAAARYGEGWDGGPDDVSGEPADVHSDDDADPATLARRQRERRGGRLVDSLRVSRPVRVVEGSPAGTLGRVHTLDGTGHSAG